MRPGVAESLGDSVSETVVMTLSLIDGSVLHGSYIQSKQILDTTLLYTKTRSTDFASKTMNEN
jgi:hypothetical protein